MSLQAPVRVFRSNLFDLFLFFFFQDSLCIAMSTVLPAMLCQLDDLADA
jgi:hypothetical protein